MTHRLRQFATFWYDFVIGDDWRTAVGVMVALGLTSGLSQTDSSAWWVLPTALLVLLPLSLWRVAHGAHRELPTVDT
jgi:hypothetical protein